MHSINKPLRQTVQRREKKHLLQACRSRCQAPPRSQAHSQEKAGRQSTTWSVRCEQASERAFCTSQGGARMRCSRASAGSRGGVNRGARRHDGWSEVVVRVGAGELAAQGSHGPRLSGQLALRRVSARARPARTCERTHVRGHEQEDGAVESRGLLLSWCVDLRQR